MKISEKRARAAADEAAVIDQQYEDYLALKARRFLRPRWGRDAFGNVVEVIASSLLVGVMIGIPLAFFVLLVGLALEVLT